MIIGLNYYFLNLKTNMGFQYYMGLQVLLEQLYFLVLLIPQFVQIITYKWFTSLMLDKSKKNKHIIALSRVQRIGQMFIDCPPLKI